MTQLTVYVPLDETLGIIPGSGVVGSPLSEWRVRQRVHDDASETDPRRLRARDIVVVDYEGNLYGAANIVTFEDRLLHAADRHDRWYPTVARLWVEPNQVRAVGTYDTETHMLTVEQDSPEGEWLDRWIDRFGEPLRGSPRSQRTLGGVDDGHIGDELR